MGVSITKIFGDSWKLHKKHFNKIIPPFILMGIIYVAFILVILGAAIIMMPQSSQADVGGFGSNPFLSAIGANSDLSSYGGYEEFDSIMSIFSFMVVLIIGGIIVLVLTMMLRYSTYKPIDDAINKRRISSWTKNFGGQFIKLLKVVAANILIFLPLIVILAIGMVFIVILPPIMILFFIIAVIYAIVVAILTMFVQYNIVLKNKGIIKSIKSSIKAVKRNVGACILFLLAWIGINILLSLIGIIPCLGFILVLVIQYGILIPLWIYTYVMLGNKIVK